jgi:hypothetical protein
MSTEQPISSSLTKAEQIEAAFRKFDLLPDSEMALKRAVENISSINGEGKGTFPKKFSNADVNVTKTELRKLVALSKKLADHIEEMHAPAITVMLDKDFRFKLSAEIRSTAANAESSLKNLDHLLSSLVPPEMLKTDKGGRRENSRAKATSTILAYYYKNLTGLRPTITNDPTHEKSKPKGPFFNLVEEVFRILGLEEKPEHYAVLAAELYPLPNPPKID